MGIPEHSDEATADDVSTASLWGLISALLNRTEWQQQLRHTLQACSHLVLQKHCQALELEGLHAQPALQDQEEQSLPESSQVWIESLCSALSMPDTRVAAQKFYHGRRYRHEHAELPAETQFQLLDSIWEALGTDFSYSDRPGEHYWSADAAPQEVKSSDLRILAKAYTGLNSIAGTLLFLHNDYLNAHTSMIDPDKHVLKEEVDAAISSVSTSVELLKSNLQEAKDSLGCCRQGLRMSTADAEYWMLCAERLLPHLKQDVIEAFMERMQSFQDRLATKPNVEACINDRVFNKALVKKNVLSWPGRNAFSMAVLSLQKTMINAQAQYQTYRLNPPLSENKQLSEHFTAGADMFQSGREVVRLIAAASIVLEGPDDKRAERARKELEKKSALPEALRLALESTRDTVKEPPCKKPRQNAALAIADTPIPSSGTAASSTQSTWAH